MLSDSIVKQSNMPTCVISSCTQESLETSFSSFKPKMIPEDIQDKLSSIPSHHFLCTKKTSH
jgi:hypothetical protein